jgi:hypothetical protein
VQNFSRASAASRPWLLLQAAAALVFLEGCHLLAVRGLEPFASWFYVLAWWPYIFLIDTFTCAVEGTSLLRDRPAELAAMLPWSVFIWLIFELFNLRLANWHYINVTGIFWQRWVGYLVSFATVLPAVLLTAELLRVLGLFRGAQVRPIPRTTAWYPWFWGLGLLCGLLPLLWPRYFFSLVWGTFVFLLEPFIHRAGGHKAHAPSLMADLERGDPRRIYLLLAAGLVCGGLWEFWNFWAHTKWVYSVPYFTDLKLFEMPLAGFLGFPPFALECFVMYSFIGLCLEGAGGRRGLVRGLAAAGVLAVTYLVAFQAIDGATVISFLK